jgi:hypothetical protein
MCDGATQAPADAAKVKLHRTEEHSRRVTAASISIEPQRVLPPTQTFQIVSGERFAAGIPRNFRLCKGEPRGKRANHADEQSETHCTGAVASAAKQQRYHRHE